MSNTDPTKKPMVNSDPCEEYVVPASNKTPAVLLIYIVKSGKTPGNDRRKKTST